MVFAGGDNTSYAPKIWTPLKMEASGVKTVVVKTSNEIDNVSQNAMDARISSGLRVREMVTGSPTSSEDDERRPFIEVCDMTS